MKKLIFLVIIVALVWVAWPVYSMYQIYGGLKTADVSVLNNKIDFTTLRTNMKPSISNQVDGVIADSTKGAGALSSVLGPQIGKLKGKIVDSALNSVVTAKGLAKVFKAGGDVTGPIKEMVMGQMGKLGGLGALTGGGGNGGSSGGGLGGLLGGLTGGQKSGLGGLLGGFAAKKAGGLLGGGDKKPAATAKADTAPSKPAKYGIGNLKRFAFTSPTRMVVGVAKDASVDGADVTAVMEFKNFDWKLTNLIPRPHKQNFGLL